MRLPKVLSPTRAANDLRFFLALRKPHELWFLVAAMILTLAVILALDHDATERREYKPNIIYVEQWPASRTDAEIVAQQKIDGPKEKALQADFERRKAANAAAFKRLDDSMTRAGF